MNKQKPVRFLAGCKTCRYKPVVLLSMADGVVCGAWCFIPQIVGEQTKDKYGRYTPMLVIGQTGKVIK